MPERRLLGPDGQPIDPAVIAALREEISPTGAIYNRPPFQGHLAFGINPQALARIIRAADAGNSLEWMILAEEIEELYPHYSAVLAKRRRQVVQLPITVQCVDEQNPEFVKHADFVRDWIQTQTLQRALYDMTDAIGKGFSIHEIIWEQKPGSTRPVDLEYRSQRFFEISWLDGKTCWLRTESGFQELMPHKFLTHVHRSKSGVVIRSGLTRIVAFLWAFATFTMRDWALFVQGYGLPIRLGKYGPAASDNDKRTLWRAVSSIAGDVAAIIPDSMQMEIVSAPDKAAGANLYEKRMDWLDREVSKLVLGGTAGTDAISGGHAVGREHRAGEDDVEKFDAFLLQTTVNQQLIPAMIAFTFGPQEQYPTVAIGRPTEVPIKDLVEAVADLGSMGLKVKASEIRDRLQLSKPEEGDEVVGGAPAPVPKPEIPTPAKRLQEDGFSQRGTWLGNLIARHAEAPPEVLEAMTDRLAEEAAGALAGLTEAVKREFTAATDMRDLARRLSRLQLSRADFTEAMARGMAVAELAGQMSLIEELRHRS